MVLQLNKVSTGAITGALVLLIAAALGAGGVYAAAAQETVRAESVRIRAARFWRGEGKTLIEAIIGVPVRATEGASANASVDLFVRDEAGRVLFSESWTDTISARLAAVARARTGTETTTPVSFAVQPGSYTITAVVTRGSARDSARIAVQGFASQPLISDVLVTGRIRALGENEQPTSAETRKGRYAIERGAQVTIFPTEPKLSYYVELYPVGSAPVNEKFEYAIQRAAGGAPLFKTERPITVSERGGIDVAAVPVAGLPPGDYTLVLTARAGERTDTRSAAFTMGVLQDAPAVAGTGAGRTEADVFDRYFTAAARPDTMAINQLVEALTLASPGEAVPSSTARLPVDAKRIFLARFWSRFPDPKPATPQHELIEEYMSRVAVVSRDYNEKEIGRSGARTDRGRIFLKYGVPDTKQILPMSGNRSAEVWKYTRQRGIKFAFLDETGFSNFNLVFTNDPNEQTLADWQERVRDVETIRLILSF